MKTWRKVMDNSKKYSENDIAIGKVYKMLRISKGFSQKEAAGDEISVTQLSKFENGYTIVSTNHFMIILQNINVNLFEFQNSYNQYLEEKDLLLFNTELTNALMEKNFIKLKLLLKELELKLELNSNLSKNKKLKLDYIRTKSILSFISNDYSLTKNEINFLKNYLYDLKEWGQYDIHLFGQCAQFFDLLQLSDLVERMISPSQINYKLHYIELARIQSILNIINIFIENNMNESARKLIKYLEDSKIHEYFMFEKITLIYNEAHLNYKKGILSGLDTMEKCQKILEFCNCYKTANWMAKEIDEIKK